MALLFWYLVKSDACALHCTLDMSHFTRHQKHTDMYNWLPCKFKFCTYYLAIEVDNNAAFMDTVDVFWDLQGDEESPPYFWILPGEEAVDSF